MLCLAAVLCVTQLFSGVCAQSSDEITKQLFDEYIKADTSDARRREIVALMRPRPVTGYRKLFLAGLKSETDVDRTLDFATALRVKGIFKEVRKLYDGEKRDAVLKYFIKSRDPDCSNFVVSRFMEAKPLEAEFKSVSAALKLDCIPIGATELIKGKLNDQLRASAAQEIVVWQLALGSANGLIANWQALKEGYQLESRTGLVSGEPLLDTGVWSFTSAKQVGENYRLEQGGKAACTAFPVAVGERDLTIRARVAILGGRGATVRLGWGSTSSPSRTIGAKATPNDWEAEMDDPTKARKSSLTARQWIEFRWLMEYKTDKKVWRVTFYTDAISLLEGIEMTEPPTSLVFDTGQQQLLIGSIDYKLGK
jgi:hypothetical protein